MAAWLVWGQGGWWEQKRPLGSWVTQLLLNPARMPRLPGLQRPGAAFAGILLLWMAILTTRIAFLVGLAFGGSPHDAVLVLGAVAGALNATRWRSAPA